MKNLMLITIQDKKLALHQCDYISNKCIWIVSVNPLQKLEVTKFYGFLFCLYLYSKHKIYFAIYKHSGQDPLTDSSALSRGKQFPS